MLAFVALVVCRATAAERASASRRVEITIAGAPQDAQDLQTVMSELLGRLDVTATYTQSPDVEIAAALGSHAEGPPAVARVWLDLRTTGVATVYIADQGGDWVLVRRVPRRSRGDEVAREELAHIVESTVDALLSGGRIGVAGEVIYEREPPPAAAELRSAPPASASRAVGFSLGYEAMAWSDSGSLVHGPLVSVGFFSVGEKVRIGIRLSGQMRFPTEIEHDPIGVRLDHAAIRLVPEMEFALGRAWALRAGLGAGVDPSYVQPVVSAGAPAETDPSRWTVVPIARALVGVGYSLAPGRSIALIAGADVDLSDTRYFVQLPNGSEDVFRPWRVRPTVGLSFGLDLFAP